MPMGAVTLKPGVDVEKTYSLNEAGVSQSQLIRFKNGMVQSYGGWTEFNPTSVGSTVRDLHAWRGFTTDQHIGIGCTQSLTIYHSDTQSFSNVTPQITINNPSPNFSISSGSNQVTVADPNSGPTIYDTVFFNTPVAVGNLLLNGAYPVATVLSTGSYIINSSVAASTTIASSGILPIFNTSSGNAAITVTLPNNNFHDITGLLYDFYAPTTVGGLTVQGPYEISSIIDSTQFTITAGTQASATAASTMNAGLAQLVYYIAIGPQISGSGFGAGGFGLGGFGTGSPTTGTPGTPITTTDWSQENWGEFLLACPKDGPIYKWSMDSGLQTAQVIPEAPFFNGGIFISMPQQILVAWKSTQSTGVQDNLVVRWCNAGDFTNWIVSSQTTAGSFHIPTGSIIIGGLQAPNYGLIWTDVDVWVMMYVGGDVIFNFTRVGSGCGLIGQHAAGVINGSVYWCGLDNFFTITPNGVAPIPCTVWDFIFQNINTANASKVQCAPNSVFNEIMWLFPAGTATENNAYVKLNVVENSWDYGFMDRTAWMDISIFGNPIAADSGGYLWQHENGTLNPGAGNPSFTSGWWAISEGNELSFVDYVIPDFKWGFYGGSQNTSVNMTFYSADYPGDIPRSYGPYTVTQGTEYLTPRIRGRLMQVAIQSLNEGFFRLGRIRYRYAPAGRR
jgi:hypothetical protein